MHLFIVMMTPHDMKIVILKLYRTLNDLVVLWHNRSVLTIEHLSSTIDRAIF